MRIDGSLGPAQSGSEGLRPLAVIPRPVIAPDGVMVSDGATGVDDGIGDGALDRPPLLDLLATRGRGNYGEVGGGAVRVDVSEAAGDLPSSRSTTPDSRAAPLAHLAQSLLGGSGDALVKSGEALPGDGSLEGFAENAGGHEEIPHVGSAKKCLTPGANGIRPIAASPIAASPIAASTNAALPAPL